MSFLTSEFPMWLTCTLFPLAMLMGFAGAMAFSAHLNAGNLSATLDKLSSKSDEDDDDEDGEERVWTVLVKFKDGGEARWRNVTKWAQTSYGTALELTTDKGAVIIPLAHTLWIVDEEATPERMESKKSV